MIFSEKIFLGKLFYKQTDGPSTGTTLPLGRCCAPPTRGHILPCKTIHTVVSSLSHLSVATNTTSHQGGATFIFNQQKIAPTELKNEYNGGKMNTLATVRCHLWLKFSSANEMKRRQVLGKYKNCKCSQHFFYCV